MNEKTKEFENTMGVWYALLQQFSKKNAWSVWREQDIGDHRGTDVMNGRQLRQPNRYSV